MIAVQFHLNCIYVHSWSFTFSLCLLFVLLHPSEVTRCHRRAYVEFWHQASNTWSCWPLLEVSGSAWTSVSLCHCGTCSDVPRCPCSLNFLAWHPLRCGRLALALASNIKGAYLCSHILLSSDIFLTFCHPEPSSIYFCPPGEGWGRTSGCSFCVTVE